MFGNEREIKSTEASQFTFAIGFLECGAPVSFGFRIWKEHIKLSSMLNRAPALSNSPQ
jgi:hypothetical protein